MAMREKDALPHIVQGTFITQLSTLPRNLTFRGLGSAHSPQGPISPDSMVTGGCPITLGPDMLSDSNHFPDFFNLKM